MDTLLIHDTFEPYFDGRRRFEQTAAEPKAEGMRAQREAVRGLRRERLLPVRISDLPSELPR